MSDQEKRGWPVHEHCLVKVGWILSTGKEVRRYDPLAHQAPIVNDFSKLHEGDIRGLESFVRTWGLLGWNRRTGPPATRGEYPPGEPLRWIWGHVRNVRLVLELSSYLQKGDIDGLGRLLDSYRALASALQDEVPIALTDLQGKEFLKTFPWTNPETVARQIIGSVIDHNFEGLQYDPESSQGDLASPNLIAAIYWHLTHIVRGGDRRVGRCIECGDLFVATHGRQKFCPSPWRAEMGSQEQAESRCASRNRKRRRREKKGD